MTEFDRDVAKDMENPDYRAAYEETRARLTEDPWEVIREALLGPPTYDGLGQASYTPRHMVALNALTTLREQMAVLDSALEVSESELTEAREQAERQEAVLREIAGFASTAETNHPAVDIARAALSTGEPSDMADVDLSLKNPRATAFFPTGEPSEPGQITAWKRGAGMLGEPSE